MIVRYLVAAISAMSFAPVLAADIHTNAPERVGDIEALTAIKIVKWRSLYWENDADGLADFLTDDFVLVGPQGSMSFKDDEVSFLRDTGWEGPEDFLYTVTGILFQGPDAAIVYGHGDSTRADDDGNPCAHRYWSSNVLRREEGEWKASFSSVAGSECTPLEEAP